MKIAFDANPLFRSNKSGVSYFTQGLISSIAKNVSSNEKLVGHYHNFLGRKSEFLLPKLPHTTYKASRLIPTKLINVGRRVGIQLPFEVLLGGKADIYIFTNFVAMPLMRGGKKVSIIYDLGFLDCPEYLPVRLMSYLKKWVPYSIKTSDLIFVNSEFTKKRLSFHYKISSKKIIVIPIPPIIPQISNKSKLERLNITRPYILFVGTIEPRKNIKNLVQAFSKLPKKILSTYTLVLAGGKGWKDQESLAEIKKLQHSGVSIVLTGYVTDQEKAALYQNSLFCIQPSFYEGFGMPILEAMSYRKAVLCSDIEVFREVAGKNAMYFDPSKHSSITSSLLELISNKMLRTELENLSKKHIQSYPTWDEVGIQTLNILRRLASNRAQP